MATPAFSLYYVIILIYMQVNASLLKKSVILFNHIFRSRAVVMWQDSKDWCKQSEQILRVLIL